MPERGNHPGPLLMWDALFPPSQSVRTSSCPGQETAARRPPGRRGGLSPLAPPSPPSLASTPPQGKGSEEPCRPETCSDQKLSQGKAGSDALPISAPDPVPPLSSVPPGSYLAKSKFQPLSCMGFPGGASGKEPACQCRRNKRCIFDPWVRKIPWRKTQQPIPVFLPGESPWTEEPGRL